jgi:hypothetical protein
MYRKMYDIGEEKTGIIQPKGRKIFCRIQVADKRPTQQQTC